MCSARIQKVCSVDTKHVFGQDTKGVFGQDTKGLFGQDTHDVFGRIQRMFGQVSKDGVRSTRSIKNLGSWAPGLGPESELLLDAFGRVGRTLSAFKTCVLWEMADGRAASPRRCDGPLCLKRRLQNSESNK